jgi:formylglycine-generating enzyme required for sulfatase activity
MPFLILDLVTTPTVGEADASFLELLGSVREFSGFSPNGTARYETRSVRRTLRFERDAARALPLLLPDPDEAEALAVHEVVLKLRMASVERPGTASYGSIEISGDVPGATVLLDGGIVGRLPGAGSLTLAHVRTGRRQIELRDFSGRGDRRAIEVEPGSSIPVELALLPERSQASAADLVPVGRNPQGYEELWRPRDAALVVRIPGGDFLRGSPDGEGQPDEHPQSRVHVSEFLIDKTEVTWRQFRAFAEATGSQPPPTPVSGAPQARPVSFVLWEEADAYCAWVGGRLPTEAEWEKAARGVEGSRYPWGASWEPRCNAISGGLHQPEDVGRHGSCVSPYGVLDMQGNMWEWCSDWYDEAYYAEALRRDPKGPATGSLRVKRGGAWMSQPNWLRSAYRAKASPHSRNVDHGFRCVHEAPE